MSRLGWLVVALLARVSSCIILAKLASQWISEDTPTVKGYCPVCAARTVESVCRDRRHRLALGLSTGAGGKFSRHGTTLRLKLTLYKS